MRSRRLPNAFLAFAIGVSLTLPAVALDVREAHAVTITSISNDPGRTLRHGWSPSVAIESGVANSCVKRASDVSKREHLCRVVDGYEGVGDGRNWKLDFPTSGESPLRVKGSNSSKYGFVVVLDGGMVYEGCTWSSPSNDYTCDYRMRKPIVLKTSGNALGYALRKLWSWTKYVGNTLGCAGGIATLWYGGASGKVTLPILSDCADGPM